MLRAFGEFGEMQCRILDFVSHNGPTVGMHKLQWLRVLTLGAGVALAALSGACQSAENYVDQLQAQPGNASSIDDARASPLVSESDLPTQKLPPKDPHAFGIGAVLPLTGPRADSGNAMRTGLELAVAEINAAGGINNQPIQLDVLDDQNDLAMGAGALQQLRDRGEAVLLVGDGALAIAGEKFLGDCPQLVCFLCDYVAALKATPNNGLRIYLNGDEEVRVIADYLNTEAVTRIAIVHQNDYAGESHKQYFSYQFSSNHDIEVRDEAYAGSESDFSLLAKVFAGFKGGALIMAGGGTEYPKILTAFDHTGWQGQVFGIASVDGLAGLSAPTGLATTAGYPLPDYAANPRGTEAGRAFADAYHAKYGSDPALPAAYAYDTLHGIALAAKQPMTNNPKVIRESFIGLRTYTGAVGRYDIKDDGDTEMPLQLMHADGSALPPAVKPAEAAPVFQRSDVTAPGMTPGGH